MPVTDAVLIGSLIGVAANADMLGLGRLKAYGLGQSEHDVLSSARRQEKSNFIVTPNVLLKEVRITSGALTACINRLAKKGLVIRLENEGDQRSKPIQLTQKGLNLIDVVTNDRFLLAEEILSIFSISEKTALRDSLEKLQSNILKRL